VKRVTGQALTGDAAGGIIHLINSGSATLDGTGLQVQDGKPAMNPTGKSARRKHRIVLMLQPGTLQFLNISEEEDILQIT
jgi:L-fucose isomerase-like protein